MSLSDILIQETHASSLAEAQAKFQGLLNGSAQEQIQADLTLQALENEAYKSGGGIDGAEAAFIHELVPRAATQWHEEVATVLAPPTPSESRAIEPASLSKPGLSPDNPALSTIAILKPTATPQQVQVAEAKLVSIIRDLTAGLTKPSMADKPIAEKVQYIEDWLHKNCHDRSVAHTPLIEGLLLDPPNLNCDARVAVIYGVRHELGQLDPEWWRVEFAHAFGHSWVRVKGTGSDPDVDIDAFGPNSPLVAWQVSKATIKTDLVLSSVLANAYHSLGLYYVGKGDWDQACRAFDMALNISPKDSVARYNRAATLVERADEHIHGAVHQVLKIDELKQRALQRNRSILQQPPPQDAKDAFDKLKADSAATRSDLQKAKGDLDATPAGLGTPAIGLTIRARILRLQAFERQYLELDKDASERQPQALAWRKEARGFAQQAIKISPAFVGGYTTLAEIHFDEGDLSNAFLMGVNALVRNGNSAQAIQIVTQTIQTIKQRQPDLIPFMKQAVSILKPAENNESIRRVKEEVGRL